MRYPPNTGHGQFIVYILVSQKSNFSATCSDSNMREKKLIVFVCYQAVLVTYASL